MDSLKYPDKEDANVECAKCGSEEFKVKLVDYGFVFKCVKCGNEHLWEQ
jgi:predicted nucleic-acid-binding Zn-ribbon protein